MIIMDMPSSAPKVIRAGVVSVGMMSTLPEATIWIDVDPAITDRDVVRESGVGRGEREFSHPRHRPRPCPSRPCHRSPS